jgi:hypothetical protein
MQIENRLRLRKQVRKSEKRLVVARVIEFYIPSNFRKNAKWIPVEYRGRVIEFPPPVKKSA